MSGKHLFKGIRRRPLTLADLFDRAVLPEPNTGCWLWLGSVTTRGYGQVTHRGKSHIVSRLTYELAHGPLAPGLFACHRCDTPLCVNPDHLFAGTAKDNMRDMWRKGRENLVWLKHRDRTWCQRRLHHMTPENTILKANDAHQCRACKYMVENERRRVVAARRADGEHCGLCGCLRAAHRAKRGACENCITSDGLSCTRFRRAAA